MFEDANFFKYMIDENNLAVGKINVNMELIKNNTFNYPFIRNNTIKSIEKIGNRNYQELDAYVVNSLKDYYNRLQNATEDEKGEMWKNYSNLYSIWRDLHNSKISKNLVEIDNIYDALLFELYLIGYYN